MLNSLLRGRLGANIDLRSPSANIDRTPIILATKVEPNSKIVLEDVTDNISCLSLEPKKLLENDLECSVEKIEQKSENRKSYLETNMDCLETDLDTVKTVPKLKKSIYNTPHLKSDVFDPRSPSSDFCRTPILKEDYNTEYLTPLHENSKVTIINETLDPRLVSNDIFRTPINLPSVPDDDFLDCLPGNSPVFPVNLSKSPGEENVLNISTNDQIVENKIILKSTKLDEIKKDFAKKYGKNIKNNPVNQVYEDKEFYKVTPRKALSASGRTPLSCVRNKPRHLRSKSDITPQENRDKSKSNGDAVVSTRTPLSCLRNIDDKTNSMVKKDIRKVENHLTMVNDLTNEVARQKSPRKSAKVISRIPTYKPKAMNAGVENLDSAQLRSDIWDKDSSVVI